MDAASLRKVVGCVVIGAPLLTTAAPVVLPHSGMLLGADDLPVNTPSVPMRFSVHATQTGGNPLWTSDACPVAVQRGRFAVSIGDACSGTPALDETMVPPGTTRWLEVSVGGVTLLPRLPVSSVPSAQVALRSLDAEALGNRLSSAGTVNTASNPVDWTQLKNVPADVVAGGNYSAGSGLQLDGRQFSIATGGIVDAMLAGAISGSRLAPGTVGTAQLADGAVTTNKLADGAVTASKIAAGAITAAQFAPGALDGAKPASSSIDSSLLSSDTGSLAKVTAGTLSVGATGIVAGTALHGAVKTDSAASIPNPDSVPFGFRAAAESDGAGLFAWKQGSDQADGVLWYGDDSNARLRVMRGTWDGTKQNLSDVMTFDGGGNVGLGTTSPGRLLDINGTFRAGALESLANNVVQTSAYMREFSGVVSGPDNWPNCGSAPNKDVTLGRLTNGSWSTITVEITGTHRGMWGGSSYFDYTRWVIVTGDYVSIRKAQGIGSNRVMPLDSSGNAVEYDQSIGNGFDLRFRFSPNCGAGLGYTYTVRYGTEASFVPSNTRSF